MALGATEKAACPLCGQEFTFSLLRRPELRHRVFNHLGFVHANLSIRERSIVADLAAEVLGVSA